MVVYGKELSYALLRQSGRAPRVHPNGFVQLDLGDNIRLHIWPKPWVPIPRPKVVTDIHDHTFDFESTIILGCLINEEYDFSATEDGLYHLYEVQPYAAVGIWTPMVLRDSCRYSARVANTQVYCAGESYSFPAMRFHKALWSSFTVTVMKVGMVYRDKYARVACLTDELPDNDFRRETDEELLWNLVKRACDEIECLGA